MLKIARKALRRVVLGDADLPQQCTVAMRDPQSEVEVWLHGLGPGIDVTSNHMVACASPSTIAVGLNEPPIKPGAPLLLKFHQRGGDRALLGQLELQSSAVVQIGAGNLQLLEVRKSENYCLPRLRILSYSLFHGFLRARNSSKTDVLMTPLSASAMTVLFSCPRPVVLVSLASENGGNIFPMNLMGPVGSGYFAFALNSRRRAAQLVESARRVAISSVPFDQAAAARQMGRNHRRDTVNWSELPFRTTPSAAFGIPVPAFASRVREMEIEAVRKLGSHTLFVARIIRDEHWSDDPQFFMIHGLYQAKRQTVVA
jgi:flavin reductase (DIM6/NTAB) family NADH-FMN oxidoreductase RutF